MDDDAARQAATNDDRFTLTVQEVAQRYELAGHPRTIRTLQRYCKNGHLDSRKIQTTLGDVYLVAPHSVERHLAQITEIEATTSRVQPRLVATAVAAKEEDRSSLQKTWADADQSRPVATPSRYVAQLEKENDFLRGQVVVKDTQIANLLERGKETNMLVHRLQTMLAPLLGSPHQRNAPHDRPNVEAPPST